MRRIGRLLAQLVITAALATALAFVSPVFVHRNEITKSVTDLPASVDFPEYFTPAASAGAAPFEGASTDPAVAGGGGAFGAAWGGGHDVARHRGHGIQVVGEHVGIEVGTVAALIPLRGLGVDSLESLAPVFFDAQ